MSIKTQFTCDNCGKKTYVSGAYHPNNFPLGWSGSNNMDFCGLTCVHEHSKKSVSRRKYLVPETFSKG